MLCTLDLYKLLTRNIATNLLNFHDLRRIVEQNNWTTSFAYPCMNTNVCFMTTPNTYYGNREQRHYYWVLNSDVTIYMTKVVGDIWPLPMMQLHRSLTGHVLRLCPSWRHNPHLDLGPFSIHREVGNSLSFPSISLRIRVDFGRPLFQISCGLGITTLVSSGSGHANLSFNGWNTGS